MENLGESAEVGIKGLCAQWKAAAVSSEQITIGQSSESHRLLANGVQFHELTYDQLREAAVGLADVLLLPGMNTVIDQDHYFFWSWCAELLLGADGPLHSATEPEISTLADMTFRAALANCIAPTREAFEKARALSMSMEPNAQHLLWHAHSALPYLAFPLLEAVARRACSEYVDLKGRVLTSFPRQNGQQYRVGARCSNVGDLLLLLVETVASEPLRVDLNEVLQHIEELARAEGDAGTSGYAVVFDWRNSSLHGETSLPTIGGTVLSLLALVALDAFRADYPAWREKVVERVRWDVETYSRSHFRSPWNFYPPYI